MCGPCKVYKQNQTVAGTRPVASRRSVGGRRSRVVTWSHGATRSHVEPHGVTRPEVANPVPDRAAAQGLPGGPEVLPSA